MLIILYTITLKNILATEDGRCVACFENIPKILFEDCSHVCVCKDCLNKMQDIARKNEVPVRCPLCQTEVKKKKVVPRHKRNQIQKRILEEQQQNRALVRQSEERELLESEMSRGSYDFALKYYQSAAAANPAFAHAHFSLGILLENQGDHDGAIKHLEAAIAANPKHEKAR